MTNQVVKTIDQFNKKLVSFGKAVTTTQNSARECSNFAISHFVKCGDIGPAQRFYDALRKDGVAKFLKRDGYLTWLFAHAPITFKVVDGKQDTSTLVKDKSAQAQIIDEVHALAVPYWMYSQDKDEEIVFTQDDVWKLLAQASKKLHGKRYVGDVKAMKSLAKVDALIMKEAPDLLPAK